MSDQERFKEIEEKLNNSTKVVTWYAHPTEVRGPFNRWLTVSEVADEYKKHVAPRSDDAAYAACAMNNVPWLIALVHKKDLANKIMRETLEVSLKYLNSCGNICALNCDIEVNFHVPECSMKQDYIRVLAKVEELLK